MPTTTRKLEYLPLDDVKGALKNPKSHSEDGLAASLERFGFTEPPLLDERTGRLVVGHGRLDALRARRDRGEEPPDGVVVKAGAWLVPVQRGWSSKDENEAAAYLLASNQLTTAGGWTDDLGPMLDDLAAAGVSLDGLGWTADDLDALMPSHWPQTPQGNPDEDDVVAPPEPVTRTGDMWEIGPHRLVCGDARDEGAYAALLGGALADLVWTDPPYGVEIVGGSHGIPAEERRAAGLPTLDNDDAAGLPDLLASTFALAAKHCRPGAVWWVAAPGGPRMRPFADVLDDLGIWHETVMWVKNSLVMGQMDYHYRHEMLFYGWTPGAAHKTPPDRARDTVFAVDRPQRSTEHPTMKPVALITQQIESHTNHGDLVLDPFCGSGSTLIAAANLGRRGYGIELDPAYCDVTLTRLQRHTGDKPTRDGVSLDFTAAD